MASPAIFSGRRSKLLTADGLLNSNGSVNDNDGLINYIKNGHAEVNTTGWATYADAAGARPVDGTGGSPTVTWTRSTSSPMRGQASFLLTKDAVNRQGEGASYDFTIDVADQTKVLQISMDYTIGSGTYAGGTSSTDSDLIVYLYDVTNAVLIEPAPIKLDGAVVGTQYKFTSSFQAASNSTSYRLIVHTATTSASAYTVKFDSVKVSPQVVSVGGSIGDWIDFTPTGTFSSNATYTGRWRRVGANAEIQWRCSFSGGTSGSNAVLNLPSGLVMDSTKMNNATIGNTALGIGALFDASAGYGFNLTGDWSSSTAIILRQQDASGATVLSSNGISATSPVTIATGDAVIFSVSVPIVGWGSSQVLSSETDTRVVAAVYSTASAPTITSGGITRVNFDTKEVDTHGAVTTGASWVFTAPLAGIYVVEASATMTIAAAGSDFVFQFQLFKNGSDFTHGPYVNLKLSAGAGNSGLNFSRELALNAGDTIDLRINNNSGTSRALTADTKDNHISIRRLSGPSQIAATETVAARYYGCATSLTGSDAAFTYATKDYDTHGMVSGSTVTIPVAGKYRISAKQQYLGTFASSNSSNISIFKTGSKVSESVFTWPASGSAMTMAIVDEINCLAGDTIQIQGSSAGSGLSVNNSTTRAVFTISRIGI